MSKRLSLYTVLVCTAFCSSALAVQPSIRAGSISLNNGPKPNANTITPTQGSAVNTVRSASVPKFSTAIVPVTTQQNNNSVSSAALESLRQEIDRLRGELTSARVELEQNQITRNDIEEQINELDLTKTNTDLKNALAELERQNQEATEVLDSIQTQTARFTDSINTDIDNRLMVHGVIDQDSRRTFATKSDINPEVIAENLAGNQNAMETLAEQIGTDSSEVQELILSDLKSRGIVSNDSEAKLQVLKTSDLDSKLSEKNVITTENITNNTVKEAISDAGFATKNELPKINEETVSAALQGSKTIDNAVVAKLKDKNILDENESLKVATKDEITADALESKLGAKFVKPDAITADALEPTLATKFAKKGEVGIDESAVTNLLKTKQILADDGTTLKVATKDEITADALENTLKEKFAKKGETVELDTAEVMAALNKDNALVDSLSETFASKDLENTAITTKNKERTLSEYAKSADVADKTALTTLQNSVAIMDSDINTQGSLLYKIKNNTALQKLLKGEQGPAGSSFNFKRTVATVNDLPRPCEQSDAYLVKTTNLLYICSCDNAGCDYGEGVEFAQKGEPGENAWTAYCKENYAIVSALYDGIEEDCSNFYSYQYNAIMAGSEAYCLSLAQNPSVLGDLTSGIGKKLANTFTTEKMSAFKSTGSVQDRLRLSGFKLSKTGSNTGTFMEACKARYDEIMAGADAEKPEITYCKAPAANYTDGTTLNRDLARKLYPTEQINDDCSNFTAEMYAGMVGGADAFCANLTATFNTVDLTKGAGLKLAKVYATEKSVSLDAAKDALNTLKRKTPAQRLNDGTFSILQKCIDNYNSIMNGEDAMSVEEQYCRDNFAIVKSLYPNNGLNSEEDCADKTKFSNANYTAIMGGAKAYCLSLAQNPAVLGDLSSGIGKRLADKLGATPMESFINTSTNNTPAKRLALTGFKTSKTGTSTGKFMDACEARYDEIMAGADGAEGKSAARTWCEAHVVATGFKTVDTVKKMSAAKTLNAFAARNNNGANLVKSGNEGYFTSMEACIAAVEADPSLMGGESAEDAKFNADIIDGKKTFTLDVAGKNALIASRGSFASDIQGKTVIPNFNAATGQITYTLSDMPSVPTSVSGIVTTSNLDSQSVRNALTNAGVTTDDTLVGLGLVTRNAGTNALELSPTVMRTTDIGNENTATGQAMRNAGVMMADDISNANSTTGQAMRNAGVMMASDISNANSTTAQAMRSASVSQMADLGLVTVTGTGTNQTVKSNALTASNLAGQLQTTLADSGVQNTLRASGVMMSSDAGTNMFSANDVMNMLSSLQVNTDGSVGIKTTGTSGQNLVNKLSTAGVSASDINKLKATTNIATSVAAVATSTVNTEELNDREKCNGTEYMFWNNQQEKCMKCPDGTVFKNKESSVPSERCVCEDPALFLSYTDGEYQCRPADNQDECLEQEETYWHNGCNICPAKTHFDKESETRCVCDEEGYTFSASSGKCEKLGSSECKEGSYWSPSKEVCAPCPDEAPYEEGRGCVCKEGEQMFNNVIGTCMKECPDGSEFNPETRMCVCKDGGTLNVNKWKCEW